MKKTLLNICLLIGVATLTGCFTTAQYSFSLIKPHENNNLAFADESIDVKFFVVRDSINFVLENKTDAPVEIDWNQASYLDVNSTSHKIIHAGIKFIDKGNPMPVTIIPPNAKIEDIASPADYAYFSSGQYGGWNQLDLLPNNENAVNYKGKTIGLFLPIKINGTIKNYQFTFRVENVELKKE